MSFDHSDDGLARHDRANGRRRPVGADARVLGCLSGSETFR